MRGSTLLRLDPDVVRYATGVSVWGRWFIWLVTVAQLAELLSAPRPWKSRGDLLLFALFILPVSLFAVTPPDKGNRLGQRRGIDEASPEMLG